MSEAEGANVYTPSGASNQIGGVHSGNGRHRWNPGRSIHGATRTPIGDTETAYVDPTPRPEPDIFPPNGRGINPS